MTKHLRLLLLLFLLAWPVAAQTSPGNIQPSSPAAGNAQNAVTANSNGTAFTVRFYGSAQAGVTIVGTATVNFEGQPLSGASWEDRYGYLKTDSTKMLVKNTTASGTYFFDLAGDESFRARVSGCSACTVTVTIKGVPATARVGAPSGGGGVSASRLINTTSPLTGGGDLSADRTLACATCVIASSPGAGIAHFAGSTQTVTSSPIVNADITNGTIDLTTKVTGNLPAGNGGFGSDVSAASGVPLFATGTPTFTSTSGSGNFVRVTSATLVSPTLGAALATSINGNTFTTGTYTLTGTAGKTLNFTNSLTFTGTDSSSVAFGAGGTVAYTGGRIDQNNASTTSAQFFSTISDETGGSGVVVGSASPTFTGTIAAAAATFSSTIVQTSASATAFESGPNGSTNPVLRLVNSTASQADGISITGLAAGSGTNITALSSGSNSPINLVSKGTGGVVFPAGAVATPSIAGTGGAATGIWFPTTTTIGISANTQEQLRIGQGALKTGAANTFGWSNTAGDPSQATDTTISRNGAGVLQIGTTTSNALGSLMAVGVTLTGTISTSSTTDSTTTTSGALQVAGGAAIRKRVFIDGITTSSGLQTAVLCQSSGGEMIADSVACLASSGRFKQDIKPLAVGLDEVMRLRPVSYRYKQEGIFAHNANYLRERVGFVAEDLQSLDPRFVGYESDGVTPRTVAYDSMVPLLTKAIQELKAEVDTLKAEIQSLKQPRRIAFHLPSVIGL